MRVLGSRSGFFGRNRDSQTVATEIMLPRFVKASAKAPAVPTDTVQPKSLLEVLTSDPCPVSPVDVVSMCSGPRAPTLSASSRCVPKKENLGTWKS